MTDSRISEKSISSLPPPSNVGVPVQAGLHRTLKTRHITMISLGGTIGTGLFLASGTSIASAGPAGALLAYFIIGMIVYLMISSLGEMATYMPISGSFNTYAARFVDPALGFALGWNYWYSWAVTVSVELAATALIMQYWLPDVPTYVWSLICLVIILAVNLISVKSYGEAEYWFSLIKVVTVIVFIVIGIVVVCGGIGDTTYGVSTWKNGDAFHNGFHGLFSVFLAAGFSFQGTELVGVTAGESKNPHRAVPRAIRQVFWRILLFYILAIFIVGLIVPFDDPRLVSASNNVAVSPFTIVFDKAGVRFAADFMNAIILVTVLSAGNSGMYAASRTLMALAEEGKAPRLFARVTRSGVPVPALLATAAVGSLAFLSSLFGDGQVYIWLLSLSGVSGFIAWLGIAISHFRFRRAYVLQGRDLKALPYRAPLYPFGPVIALLVIAVIIAGQGFATIGEDGTVNVQLMIASYIGIPLFLALYLGFKLIKKTKLVPLADMDLDTDRLVTIPAKEDPEKNPTTATPETGLWARVKRHPLIRFLNNL